MLELKRPISFIDLETTGLDRENDRIIEIAITKIFPNGARNSMDMRVNPGKPIPAESTAIHGITDEMVADRPTFETIAAFVYNFLFGCDIGGYNSNWFDVPLLHNELKRAGFFWDARTFNMVDVGNLFKIQEPRNLANAVRFYCGHELDGAHRASNDVDATIDVFLAQLERYPDLPTTVEELAIYTNYGCKMADLSGKFVYDKEGRLLLNFGQKKGQLASENRDYIYWMYFKGSFAEDTHAICADLLGMNEEPTELPW